MTTSNQNARTEVRPIDAAGTTLVDTQVFKAVMRKVAGTVTVIGTSSDTGLHGMTATAMCSVCAEPPTILIVVNRTARTHPHIDAKKAFTVNILSQDQLKTAELFASKSPDQFQAIDFHHMDDGCPVIAEAAAYLHCCVEEQFEVGTHTIFIGRVQNAGVTGGQPLVYQEARYGRVAAG